MDIQMGFEGVEEEINALIADLDKISTFTKEKFCEEAVEGAANIVLEEEKRILNANPKYSNLAGLLSCEVKKGKHNNYVAYCGYSSDVIKNHIEALIIEFGRPGHGKRAIQKHGKDKKGRKIGVIQPYPHIRAAWFNKKNEVQEYMGNYVFEEIRKVWVKKNGR